MPVTAAPDPSGQFMVLTVADPYTVAQWRDGVGELIGAPGFRNTQSLLVDRRTATAPSTDTVDVMVQFLADHAADLGGRRVAVVVGDDAGFGMSRMTELRSELDNPQRQMRTFRGYDDAVAWLTRRSANTGR